METKVKKREWVKTAAIIFLAVLLVLTFFSNTIMNASLPEVAARQVSSGSINAKIRGSGTIAANEIYNVTVDQTYKIASVKVKEGQNVAEGESLFLLEPVSDELKQAQQDLETAERAYEAALLTASTADARENREVEKARQAYNEALAIYNQYSTMDATQIALAQAEADAELKDLQRQQKAVQKELEDAKSNKEYTQAQADVNTYQAEKDAALKELEKDGYDPSITINEANRKLRNAKDALDDFSSSTVAQLQIEYEAYYNILKGISNDRMDVMDEYCEPDNWNRLIQALQSGNYLGGGGGSGSEDDNKTVSYSKLPANISSYDELAYWVVESNKDDNLGGYYRALADVETYTLYVNYFDADDKLFDAQSILDRYESTIKRLEDGVEAVSQAVEDQQAQVDKLANAATAASQVKSAKQALEDLIFDQSLGDTANLDLKNQKEDIDEIKARIEKLKADAEGVDVPAKVPGTIGEINVKAGDSIGPDSPLCTINLIDRGYTIKIPVTQEQSRRVSVGDQAELVNYWGGDVTATLESIANNPETKGKMLIFRLDGEIDSGTTLTLSIGQKSANYDALVPNAAIRKDNNGSFVLALVAKTTPLSTRYTATRVDVQVLANDDNYTAVSGISAGEFVITTSTKPIEAGTQVRLVDE